jgi:CxxC-x17-CxxC domain-containing protein
MTIKDITIVCKDCGRKFMFRSDEQSFYEEKGYAEPTRCKDCRTVRKNSISQTGTRFPKDGAPRTDGRTMNKEMFPATCASCGNQTQVPFKPTNGKPVYCSNCYSKNR